MSVFCTIIPPDSIAAQIAAMLNKHNRLYKRHNRYTILNSPALYLVEISLDRVVGCTAVLREHAKVSKSFHTSVLPEYRGRRVGSRLMQSAINSCTSNFIYGTIRADNTASLSLVGRLGFSKIGETINKGHKIITVGRNIK